MLMILCTDPWSHLGCERSAWFPWSEEVDVEDAAELNLKFDAAILIEVVIEEVLYKDGLKRTE